MTSLKVRQVDAFIQKPDAKFKVLLVYGPDRGAVAERARALVAHFAGSLDDPFTLARLTEADFSDNPGRLQDEARAIPMLGGLRVVWLEDAGSASAKALADYLDDPIEGAVVVAEAGPLQPSAKLRKTVEASAQGCALPCYVDQGRSLDQVIDETLRANGLVATPAASDRLANILGADRGLTRMELEKLCLYCAGRERVEDADVDAICGDAAALVLDDLIDGTFEGDIERLDQAFARLIAGGTAIQAMIAVLYGHIGKLKSVAVQTERGDDLRGAVAALRPPVHFSRKESILRQARLWSSDKLDRAAEATLEAEFQSRRSDGLAETVVARHFMSLGHAARRQRHRA